MSSTDASPRPGRAAGIAMAGLAALQGAISFHHVWPLKTVFSKDTAAYYVMGRNLALGRGLVDTNLWHYLGHQTLPHPAGDYWPAGWPVVLGALLRLSGPTERAALLWCAALSVLLPLGVFQLTRVVQRGASIQAPLVAGLLVIFQGRLDMTNVITDVTLPYALCALGCVLGAYRLCAPAPAPAPAPALALAPASPPPSRDLLAGLLLTVPIWFRAEAFFLPVAFAPVILWADRAPPWRARLRRLGFLLLGVVMGQALLAAYNLWAFGRPVPPTRSLMPWMTGYNELYSFLSDPSRATWWAQGLPAILAKIRATLELHLSSLFVQLPWMLPPSAAIGAALIVRRKDARALPLVLFVLFNFLIQCVVVPVLASPDRTVMNATPWLCILAALAVAPLLERVASRPARAAALAATAGWAFLCCTWIWPHELRLGGWTYWPIFEQVPADLTDPAALASLGLHPEDVVLSKDPFQLAAVLDVRTVMWPRDGAEALSAVIATYRPRYVLTRRGEPVPVPTRLKAQVGASAWYEIVW